MIELTRLNRTRFFLNAELIQKVEGTANTVITLLSGEQIIVQEKPEQVVDLVIAYKRKIHSPDFGLGTGA